MGIKNCVQTQNLSLHLSLEIAIRTTLAIVKRNDAMTKDKSAGLAQLVEQRFCKPKVTSSILVTGTIS